MKRYKLFYILIIPILMLSSCFKDKGSYDYVDVNELAISELGGPYNVLYEIDRLVIKPKIEATMDANDPGRYSYEWRVGPTVDIGENAREIISTEKDLDYLVNFLPGSYSLYFRVHDKVTDVLWTGYTSFRVTTATATGFYLAGENGDGYADVDMVSTLVNDTIVLKSLVGDNGMPKYRNPIRMMHTGGMSSSSAKFVKLWFMTGEGSYFVNTTTMEAEPGNIFPKRVFTTFNMPSDYYPIDVIPRMESASGSSLGSYTRVVMTNDGNLFVASLLSGGDIYGNPVNRIAAKPLELFKLSPFVIYTPGRWDKYIVFDEVNNRFVMGAGGISGAAMVTVMSDNIPGEFPWNQEGNGRKLHYAENTKNKDNNASYGNSYALMKDEANIFHIYKMYATGGNGIKNGYYEVKSIAQEFNQATNYAFPSLGTFIFYSVGSKLYAYDFNPGIEKSYLVKDFGEEITMLNFDIQKGDGTELYVATYSNEKKGTIVKFKMAPDLNNLTMVPQADVHWTGLLKVKSMDYRSSTQ